MKPTLRSLLRLSARYKLVDTPCPEPSTISSSTFCECAYPEDKPINHEKPLYGTKAISWKHALVYSSTPATEWKSKVEMMPTEIISNLASVKRKVIDPMYPVIISNIELGEHNEGDVLVYPDNKVYNVTDETAFMKQVLRPDGDPSTIPHIPNSGKLILICGHTQRDIRCGLAAPLLKEEFITNLKSKGIHHSQDSENGVKVGIVSHIGGHAYAGNVLFFDTEGLTVWYGRCEPRHVDGIVDETIINKNIIKELFRGRYN